MKKKYPVTLEDKKDWFAFIKHLENIHDKDANFTKQNIKADKVKRLDLHGLSLNHANQVIKKFIIESFEEGYKKLLIITGKGLRSKVDKNPYLSKRMNVLKYSIPEFIKNDEDLSEKINRMSKASLKDGGEGAFYIFLNKVKKL